MASKILLSLVFEKKKKKRKISTFKKITFPFILHYLPPFQLFLASFIMSFICTIVFLI